jgi:hypothetical protein
MHATVLKGLNKVPQKNPCSLCTFKNIFRRLYNQTNSYASLTRHFFASFECYVSELGRTVNAKDLGNSGTWSLLLSPGPFRHLLNRFQLLYRQVVPPRCLSDHLLCHLSNSNVKWADQLLVPVVAQPVGPRIEAALCYLDQLHDVFGQGVDSIQPRKIQQVLKRSRNSFQ